MSEFIATETLLIELLLIVSVVAIAVRRLRVPYTVALVLVGLLLSIRQPVTFELTPELILALFVPPLVFEAAFHIELQSLRDNLLPIATLAVIGIVLTTLIVGGVLSAFIGISIATALVFGALMSATDPVAVVSLFRSLGAPRRLVVLMESESLFNDGTAIVIFNIVLAAAMSAGGQIIDLTSMATAAQSLLRILVDFLFVSVGGVMIGVGLGWAVSWLIARIDDYLIETTLTTVLAFGCYLIAERLNVSGVLAVVSAGIMCGNFGMRGMSPTTRIVLQNFWEFLAFFANSLVFLLIGLDVDIPILLSELPAIVPAVLAVVGSRAIVVYGLSKLISRHPAQVPKPYQHVMFWGGLRGAVSLALVLSLPRDFTDRNLLVVMAFGVVLFTVLVQGTSMSILLRWLGLVQTSPEKLDYERRHAELIAAEAERHRLEELYRSGGISSVIWHELSTKLDQQLKIASDMEKELLNDNPSLRETALKNAQREGLRARRAAIEQLLASGALSESVYSELVSNIDAQLQESDSSGV